MGNFFAELKRRQMYRVAAAYAVVAWLLLQIVNNVAPGLNLPSWAITLVIVLLAIGFPVALLFCWIQHLPDSSGQATKTARVDWLLVCALGLVIALLAYQQIASPPVARAPQQSASSAPAAQPGSISIAVLPFANVSADSSQEYFSDGMTDEITTALAKIQDLRVVGRTSAFQFKGERKDLRAIGQSLGATHLIEGSVRKVGDRVRITAQLVQAANGLNMWTNAYDREMTDVFAIQEDIAQAIAGALRIPLGLKQGESLVRERTADVESYQQYLLALARIRERRTDQAIAILEPLVARTPQFAPAWSLLALGYRRLPGETPAARTLPVEEARALIQPLNAKAESAAREAIRVDPENALAYAALAGVEFSRAHWSAAEDFFKQSLALDPTVPEALNGYSTMLAQMGRIKDSLPMRERLMVLEPLVALYPITTARIREIGGDHRAAIPVLEAIAPDPTISYNRNTALAYAYAADGRFAEAAVTLLGITGNQVSRQSAEAAAQLLRSAPTKVDAPEKLPILEGNLNFVYAYVGAPERVLEFPRRELVTQYLGLNAFASLWQPVNAPLRKTARFKAFMREAGLVDYWRAKGWPDLCKPIGADDFECS